MEIENKHLYERLDAYADESIIDDGRNVIEIVDDDETESSSDEIDENDDNNLEEMN